MKDYEHKYLLFKTLINKSFPSYKKKYAVNCYNKTYLVKFILKNPDRIIALTILPDSKWNELKKQIENKISNLTSTLNDCQVCFNQIVFHVIYCRQCSFIMCQDCFLEIQLNSDIFRCPQCRYTPNQDREETAAQQSRYTPNQDIEELARLQWIKFLSLWRQYESGIIA